MEMYCPLNGQKLLKIGSEKGEPVFWCEKTDTAYQIAEDKNVVLVVMPKCPERRQGWVSSSSISELAGAIRTSDTDYG